MRLISTNKLSPEVNLREAVLAGLAPDGGLYVPVELPSFSSVEREALRGRTFSAVAEVIAAKVFAKDLPPPVVQKIISTAFDFAIPLVELDTGVFALELFHGPTLSFKDIAARFMARLMGYYVDNLNRPLTVIVATSGDTGSAVAAGFFNVPGIRVVLLYPSGQVSPLQEQQLTTLGGNVTALKIAGTFDDCQQLVKQALGDREIAHTITLASANSINIARLLPQSFYYFYAWSQLPKSDWPVIVSVPSGNFGNLTAGVIAKKMGLPIKQFVAATNQNSVVPEYLATGIFKPRPSVHTISNAMDVGNPSNFKRLEALYNGDPQRLRADVVGYSFSDPATRDAMRAVYARYGYMLDPHGAVGYLGLKQFQKEQPGPAAGIFLETAHPAKFTEIVQETLGVAPPMPERLASSLEKEKKSMPLSALFGEFKQFLLALSN